MFNKLFKSLYFKISFMVILVEVVVFFILGYFYITQFNMRIDTAIISAAKIPGILMSQRQLNLESVRNPESIEKLLGGEEVEEAIVLNKFGQVIWASDPQKEKMNIKKIIENMDLPDFDISITENKHAWKYKEGKRFLYNMAPLLYEEKLIGFLYLKIRVIEADHLKRSTFFLFTFSSFLGILITSLGIAVLGIRYYIFKPLEKLIVNVKSIGSGMYSTLVPVKTNDEMEILADAVKEMAEHIEKADKLKDSFLANTSHELRTPLNGIIGIAESLVDGAAGELNENMKSNLKLIISSGLRLANLVNDILDFSRIKSNDITLSLKPVDLRKVVDFVLFLSKPLINKAALLLFNNIPDDIPLVIADENRLQQILHNLVGNAIKFTQAGKISVSAAVNGNYIEVRVSDTGIGIPEDQFKDIFNVFYQVDHSENRSYAGTGLGLSITQHLVKLHGGVVWLKSKVGKGSDFYFSLPVSEKTREETSIEFNRIIQQLGDNKEITAKPMKVKEGQETIANILVVDDEPINLQLLANHLSLNNYDVTFALSGEEALSILADEQFDAVLLDVMMPKMSGYEVCKIIRQTCTPNQLPIIMITAKNQVADLMEGLESGANDYITKPFSKNELLARLKSHLEIKNLNAEIEDTQKEIILRIGAIAESRSQETANHVKRVAEYCAIIGSYYGLSRDDIDVLKSAAPMHDIGKVGIPDSILNKQGQLSHAEFEFMKNHALLGYEMIGPSERRLLKTAALIALTHHEKWNGTGYPGGLKGNEIPIFGRIVAVADVFDALGSDRCYKSSWAIDQIIEYFRQERGIHFDPQLVDIFFDHFSEFLEIKDKLADKF